MIDSNDNVTLDLPFGHVADAAQSCVSMRYRYSSMLECVKQQQPFLLHSSPLLKGLSEGIDSLLQEFEEQVRVLAHHAE